MNSRSVDERGGHWYWPFSLGVSKQGSAGRQTSRVGVRADRQASDKKYCQMLALKGESGQEEVKLAGAWKVLEDEMAFVPGGETGLLIQDPPSFDQLQTPTARRFQRVKVQSFYMDRFAVTNRDFAQFVADGGYRQMDLWPTDILAHVLQFVDQTGSPGPSSWKQGRPPERKWDHPVTGVSWYEAMVYAAWVGKRLPTSAEWQRAGSWSTGDVNSGVENRYPWGNAFDPKRTNTWLGGPGETVEVNAYYDGCTSNGIYQLTGNVWEWAATQFEGGGNTAETQYVFEQTMAEIRGGAFNTYFDSQATCQFRSGQPLLFRGDNVGFRCCISADQLCPSPDPKAFLEDDHRS